MPEGGSAFPVLPARRHSCTVRKKTTRTAFAVRVLLLIGWQEAPPTPGDIKKSRNLSGSGTLQTESALGELRRTTGGLEAVLLDLQNLQSIALQWIAVFENQFPFKMNPVNFYHIV